MPKSRDPLFLVGAGFAAEAREFAGSIRGTSIYIGEYEIDCGYPLVGDLPRICYPERDPLPAPHEVELALANSIAGGDTEPVDRLCQELLKADYYLGPRLFGRESRSNPYGRLLESFPNSSYISFNYDSFLEFGLFRARRWSPHDGFGVDVAVELEFTMDPVEVIPSTNFVLHPHGSLLVHTEEFSFGPPDRAGVRWMDGHSVPAFQFDPTSVSALFHPFGRVLPGLAYDPQMTNRVVAPVPSKATGKRMAFVQAVHAKALAMVASASVLVSIGFSFASHDAETYQPILDALPRDSRLLVVSPDADEIIRRLAASSPNTDTAAQRMPFSQWVDAGYAGLQEDV